MSFDFKTAVKLYKENPTSERLSEVSEKLLAEMTLKEKNPYDAWPRYGCNH